MKTNTASRCRQTISIIVFVALYFWGSQLTYAARVDGWQALVQIDNDLLVGGDQGYTSGVRLAAFKQLNSQSKIKRNKASRLEQKLDRSRLLNLGINSDESKTFARGFGLTQLIFTPRDSKALKAPFGERPYAGWLGLEYTQQTKTKDKVNSLSITIGSTGSASLARESQNWVHRNISKDPLFQGWDSQIPAEVTVNFHYDRKQKFMIHQFEKSKLRFDGFVEQGFEVGNFRTGAYIGTQIRLGSGLPKAFTLPNAKIGTSGNVFELHESEAKAKNSAYLFAGVKVSAVLHDISLDGPIFRSYEASVESELLHADFNIGAGFTYQNFDFAISKTYRTDEFKTQRLNTEFDSVMLVVKAKL